MNTRSTPNRSSSFSELVSGRRTGIQKRQGSSSSVASSRRTVPRVSRPPKSSRMSQTPGTSAPLESHPQGAGTAPEALAGARTTVAPGNDQAGSSSQEAHPWSQLEAMIADPSSQKDAVLLGRFLLEKLSSVTNKIDGIARELDALRVVQASQSEVYSRLISAESAIGSNDAELRNLRTKDDELSGKVVALQAQLDVVQQRISNPAATNITRGANPVAPPVTSAAASVTANPYVSIPFPSVPAPSGTLPPFSLPLPSAPIPSAPAGVSAGVPPGVPATYQNITTSETSAPLPQGAADFMAAADLGPYAPGLEPLRTTIRAFETVVDYRFYRLNDRCAFPTTDDLNFMHKTKRSLEHLHATLEPFDGTNPIDLIDFLCNIKEGMDSVGKSEDVAVRVLSYLLTGAPKDTYTGQVSPATKKRVSPLAGTWPFVVNALIRRFLTRDVLREAHDKVVTARQMEGEDELAFCNRVEKDSRVCRFVFDPADVSNAFVSGLNDAVRFRVQEAIKRWSEEDATNLAAVRELAIAEGRAQRAEARPSARTTRPDGPTRSKPAGRAEKAGVMVVSAPAALAPSFPTTPTSSTSFGSSYDDHFVVPTVLQPINLVETAVALQSIFVVQPIMTMHPEYIGDALKEMSLKERDELAQTSEVPQLTPEQIRQAFAVIPRDYWAM